MRVLNTTLPDVRLIEPDIHGDDRGYFFESFNLREFCRSIGREVNFVQDNQSLSGRNVLRGLHYQAAPYAQGKLVRVLQGEVFDVAVDIRPESSHYGQWYGTTLSGKNHRQIWIPEGHAHGFLVLSDQAIFLYKTTSYWHREAERAIRWDDPTIGIDWPLSRAPILSDKDRSARPLVELSL